MNLRLALAAVMITALAARGWAGSQEAAAPAAPQAAEAPAKQSYDAIFSEMLQTLPEDKRALVDSAHAIQAKPAETVPKADVEALRAAAAAKRSQALKDLPPDVKARVDKAILDLDNRRKEKKAELKELDK